MKLSDVSDRFKIGYLIKRKQWDYWISYIEKDVITLEDAVADDWEFTESLHSVSEEEFD